MGFVEIRNLTKDFGSSRVIEDLSFTVEQGEFVTLLGPSGCGKSTLLRAIAGLVDINSGSILVAGKNITGLSPRHRNIGMVFQAYALFPNMTVAENIGFGLKMKGLSATEIGYRVDRFVELVELENRRRAYPNQLSGGQQQRVALARALASEPDVLLLDEPLSALDAKIRKSLRLQIRNLQKELKTTTLFVTHDQEEALIVSDRIFLMENGQFAQIGTPEEIYTNPGTEFAARFIGNYNVLNAGQVNDMVLSEDGFGEGTYALRPEVIELTARDANKIIPQGVVEDVIVLGNIIRYRVRCAGHPLTVDVLNRGQEDWFPPDTEIGLRIPPRHVQKIG